MMLETELQAQFLIPMALSLGFGVLIATFIILLLVPCLYLVIEDARDLLRPLLGDMVDYRHPAMDEQRLNRPARPRRPGRRSPCRPTGGEGR